MKQFLAVLSFVGVFALVPQLSFASSGSAIIPYYWHNSNSQCYLHITNISAVSVDVKIDLFDTNGNPNTSNILFGNGFASNPVLAPVPLASKHMGGITMGLGGIGSGYGLIEWSSSSSNELQALVGHMHCEGSRGNMMGIPINGYNPF